MCETGIPPNTKIRFEFERSSDKFVVMSQTSDKEAYKVKILNCCLHIPVSVMSDPVFNEIKTVLSKEHENQIAIHYRRIEIRQNTIII